MAKILVTGVAGFIGYHVAARLLRDGHEVEGLDIVNDYYDPQLKWARLDRLRTAGGFRFHRVDLADAEGMAAVFKAGSFDQVIHLAAQAGVRYSIEHPEAYIQSNLVGFLHILEGCRHHGVRHLVYASSSSVYGLNTAMPFSEHRPVGHPVSLYAATKRSNELMAHSYSHLYGLPTTGLRFFTVYGPWGRPDMALFLFTRAILAGEPIDVFNHGQMQRDFTYVDDIVEGIVRLLVRPAAPNLEWSSDTPDLASSSAPYRVYNIGNNAPVELMEMIGTVERALGREAQKNMLPMQPGDVPATWASCDDLVRDTGYQPATPLEVGIGHFIDWYLEYYGVERPG